MKINKNTLDKRVFLFYYWLVKNLLIITQKVDGSDDLLGFFIDWLKEFAKYFDKVFVITLLKGEYKLPENVFVYSLGKEKNNSKISRVFNFYRFLFQLVSKTTGVFAHMSPIFVIAVWPATFLLRKKIILWYLHRSVTMRLKLAEKLCYKIVTSTKESLNIKSDKIIEVGHGIDTEKFKTQRDWDKKYLLKELRILSVGRISQIKNYETLIKAISILRDKGLNFFVKIVGRPVMPYDFEYFEKLKKLVEEKKLINNIEFTGFVPYSHIADYYKETDIFINLAPTGGIDKVVLEAMASGCIVLTSNSVFSKYLGSYSKDLIFIFNNENDLAKRIASISSLSPNVKREFSDYMVATIHKYHDIGNLIQKISQFFL